MVVIAIFRVIKAPFIDGNLSIIDCYAEAVHVFRNFVHVIKNRLVGAPVHVIEKTVHVHENCCSRVLRILMKCPSNRGNTYVRASILHDWQGDAESTFTKGGQTKRISEELGDTWLEYGVGANFNATKNLHLYADLEATEGAKVETSYRFNLGARWSF